MSLIPNLILKEPDTDSYKMAFGETRMVSYQLKNDTKSAVRDIDFAVSTVRRKYLDSDEYVPTKEKYAWAQLPPEIIPPGETVVLKVKVEVPEREAYAEMATNKEGGDPQMVAFKINVVLKATEIITS